MRETIKSSLCCDYLYMKLLETVTLPGGMVSAADGAWTPLAWVTDRLGNVREVADMSTGTVVERNDYYAYGSRIEQDPDVINAYPQVDENRWRYAGKEEQEDVTGIPYDDFGARLYDPHLGTWMAPDPMAEKYPGISPYLYCSGDPVNVVDPDGEDWFYYSIDGKSDPSWNWRDEHEYHTGVRDKNGDEIVLPGYEVVVEFNGSREERLGVKDGKDGFLDGEGANPAIVVVYGAEGVKDIHLFTGFTMTSNAPKYTPIAEGLYNLNYDKQGKSGKIPSHWVLENRGRIPTMDKQPNKNPYANESTKEKPYKDGIFLHRTNIGGFAGGSVSTGCPLILDTDWDAFEQTLIGHTKIVVQINRSK